MHYKRFIQAIKDNLVKENQGNYERAKILRKHVADLKLKQSQLIQKNLEAVITNDILKEQLILVDQELIKVNSSLACLPDHFVHYDELVEARAEFLKNPSKIWENLPFHEKLQLQWFYFPKGIIFDGVKCRTPEICKLFQVKNCVSGLFSPKVRDTRIELVSVAWEATILPLNQSRLVYCRDAGIRTLSRLFPKQEC